MSPFFRICALIFCCTAATAIAASCAGPVPNPGRQPLDAQVLYQSSLCPRAAGKSGSTWIGTKSQLASFFRDEPRLGAEPLPLPAWAADFDFSRHRILVISMGEQPTAGYRLEYLPEESYVSEDSAHIAVKHITPPADSATAQVITRPCLLLKLHKSIQRVKGSPLICD